MVTKGAGKFQLFLYNQGRLNFMEIKYFLCLFNFN